MQILGKSARKSKIKVKGKTKNNEIILMTGEAYQYQHDSYDELTYIPVFQMSFRLSEHCSYQGKTIRVSIFDVDTNEGYILLGEQAYNLLYRISTQEVINHENDVITMNFTMIKKGPSFCLDIYRDDEQILPINQ